MLLDGGRDHVKILDFGLARSLVDPNSRATATGLISGTPRYMAPEVVLEGAEPAPAQDMYAVGVILAELALGRALWTAPTLASLFTIKLEVDTALAAVPSLLRPLVRSLLDTTPASRPTAEQARATLRRLAEGNVPIATLELELDPLPATQVIGHAPTADIAFPDMIGRSLVSLDDREATPLATTPTIQAPKPTPLKLRFDGPEPASFAPPTKEPSLQLEIAKPAAAPIASAVPAARSRRNRGTSGLVPALVAVALAIGGVFTFLHFRGKPAAHGGAGIEITITGKGGVDVEIDGHRAGKTPLTLKMAKGNQLMVISGGGVMRQITTDHDQVVDLTPR
jgi:hypothetical protein